MIELSSSTDGNDVLFDTAGNDVIEGGFGNDIINVSSGGDDVYGDYGYQTLPDSFDTLVVNWGWLTGNVTSGHRSLTSFTDAASVYYTAIDRFVVTTGAGDDAIILTYEFGSNFVSLGAGNDFVTLLVSGEGAGAHGGAGIDTAHIDFVGSTPIYWNLQTDTYSGIAGTDFSGFEHFGGAFQWGISGGIETGAGNDTIITHTLALTDNIRTGAGDDVIAVYNGYDKISDAGEGVDTLIVDYRNATGALNIYIASIGAQGFIGTIAASDTQKVDFGGIEKFDIRMGSGNDVATGGSGDDIFSGNAGNDEFHGATGNDQLVGGTGDDLLEGGDGDDRLTGGIGNDAMTGGAGYDRMYGGVGDDLYNASDTEDYVYENVGEGRDRVIASIDHTLRVNVEDLTLSGTAAIGKGNAGDNLIVGNDSANKLYGYQGNDTLDGSLGDDTLLGAEGNDTLIGGAGYDRMHGGTGDDTFVVGDAADYAYENLGEGTDRVIATINHQLRANIEVLELSGTANLRGYGNALGNVMMGNAGANLLYGKDGDDSLFGNDGADILYGESDADTLTGGSGLDRFYGGSGADTFAFVAGDFAGMGSSTADRIHDFSQAQSDRIGLAAVDANSVLGGDQAFAFIGSGAFTGVAGQLRYQQIAGNTYVQGDTDGNGAADFWIRVDGLHTLVSGDFLL